MPRELHWFRDFGRWLLPVGCDHRRTTAWIRLVTIRTLFLWFSHFSGSTSSNSDVLRPTFFLSLAFLLFLLVTVTPFRSYRSPFSNSFFSRNPGSSFYLSFDLTSGFCASVTKYILTLGAPSFLFLSVLFLSEIHITRLTGLSEPLHRNGVKGVWSQIEACTRPQVEVFLFRKK